jgi:hypothetical protein
MKKPTDFPVLLESFFTQRHNVSLLNEGRAHTQSFPTGKALG